MTTFERPSVPLGGGLGNHLRTVLLLGALTAVLVGIGGLFGGGMVYLFGLLAIAMNIGAYFWSDKLVLRMHGAREFEPHEQPALRRMVQELSLKAGLPMPRLFLLRGDQPNAFATGRDPEHGVVAVTEGLLRTMGERELRGVLAHELAHIRNRDILVASVAACIAAAVSMIAQAGQWAMIFGGGRSDDEEGSSPLAGLLMIFLAPLAATMIQLGISRSREYLADATAAQLTNDPHGLADALTRLQRGVEARPSDAAPATASLFICNPMGAARRLGNLFSTHPPIEERVERLRAMAR